MGKGAFPRSAFGHKGATGLPYFPGLPTWGLRSTEEGRGRSTGYVVGYFVT